MAGGHNLYCRYRDNGGGYLAEERLLVMGSNYTTHAAKVPREKPIAILAETPAQYAQAIHDIRYTRTAGFGFHRESVVAMDLTSSPHLVLQKLDVPIGRVRLVHDVPMNAEQLTAIHGSGARSSALPRLEKVRADLNEAGAIDVATGQGAVDARVRQILSESKENDLVVIIGHRARIEGRSWDSLLPEYKLMFHDGSSLTYAETLKARPTVWFMSCNTFDDVVAGIASVERPILGTTRPLTYTQARDASLLIKRTGGSLRKTISEIQQTPARPLRKAPGRPTPPEGGAHPGPQKTDSLFQAIVQLNDGAIATGNTIAVA
jgi:hypothetical protein